jgi:Bifunctional DNA primase/polymerase, N-terminal
MTSLMDTALAYAAKGIPVFPVGAGKEGKAPLTQNGFHDASKDPETIKAWWTKYPCAKIGMPCGRASGRIVTDIDCHPGKPSGFEHVPNWAELSDYIVKTAGGGRHLHHADDGKTAIAHPFPGVEVRGEGHYVILPGPYGYELERSGDLKPIPEFLLKNARTSRGKARLKRSRSKPIPPSPRCDGHFGKGTSTDKDDLPDFELYAKAINLIPNPDLPWGEWKRIIMAIWAAFLAWLRAIPTVLEAHTDRPRFGPIRLLLRACTHKGIS